MPPSSPPDVRARFARRCVSSRSKYAALRRRFVKHHSFDADRAHSFDFANYLYLRMAEARSRLREEGSRGGASG